MSRPFTAFEEERLIQNLQASGRARDALLVEMGCYLGFRVSELCFHEIRFIVLLPAHRLYLATRAVRNRF